MTCAARRCAPSIPSARCRSTSATSGEASGLSRRPGACASRRRADGYLWIGAEKGLVRFDGLTLSPVRADGDRRPARVRRCSAWPPRRTAACGRGCAGPRWSLSRRRVRGHPAERRPAGVGGHRDDSRRDGTMLLATLGQGAVAYRDGRFDADRARRARCRTRRSSSRSPRRRDGDVWLGTRDAGLLRVQGARVTRITEGLPDQKINCLLPRRERGLWIGTDQGDRAMDRHRGHAGRACPRRLQDLPALAMMRDRESNIWIAAGRARPAARQPRTASSAPRRTRSAVLRARDRGVRGSRRQPLDRHDQRHRALARRRLHHATRRARACRPSAWAPSTSTRASAPGSRRPTGGLYWLRDGRRRRSHAGRTCATTSSIRSPAAATTCGSAGSAAG